MKNQRANLEWRNGDVPVSVRFDDPYYSLENGLAETEHVFMAGNDLPARFRNQFHIAELGFGTGLNLLVALRAWRRTQQSGALLYTSFEAFAMSSEDMVRAQANFPELDELAHELAPHWGKDIITLPDLHLEIIHGDARKTLPRWKGYADAWFLDGFSPAKNPELWQDDLLSNVANHTAANGTAATYTAAGFVRRGLSNAGFEIVRVPGYGRKRHMTRAVKA